MGDKIANKKKMAKRAAKPVHKAPISVSDIKPTAPRK